MSLSLPAVVVLAVVAAVLAAGAFAGRARHEGADKAAWHLAYPATAVVVGVILALAYQAGWW